MNQEKQWDVITCGDVFIDLILSGFARWPQPGEEAFARALRQEAGGGAAITACGLAKLGRKVAVLGLIGSEGEWLHQRLKDCGVDDELIHRPGGDHVGLTVSVSTAKDRAYFTYAGTNLALPDLLALDLPTCQALTRARHVHLAFPVAPRLLRSIATLLGKSGCTLSLDVGWQPQWLVKRQSLQTLRKVDLFLPNEREAALLSGQAEPEAMLRVFAKAGLRGVALKLGARGSMLLWESKIYTCPPIRLKPLDTTGAGDCFDAGFIHAWLKGEAPLRCLQYGNICGALSTLRLGGLDGFPSTKQLQTRLRQCAADKSDLA